MISDVVITGYLTNFNNKDKRFRNIEYRSSDAISNVDHFFEIPLLHWTREENNVLTSLKRGTFVVIRGRIEYDESFGLYILVENIILTGDYYTN